MIHDFENHNECFCVVYLHVLLLSCKLSLVVSFVFPPSLFVLVCFYCAKFQGIKLLPKTCQKEKRAAILVVAPGTINPSYAPEPLT